MHITMYSNAALLKAGVGGGGGGVNEWMKVVGVDDKSCSKQRHTQDQKRYCITRKQHQYFVFVLVTPKGSLQKVWI